MLLCAPAKIKLIRSPRGNLRIPPSNIAPPKAMVSSKNIANINAMMTGHSNRANAPDETAPEKAIKTASKITPRSNSDSIAFCLLAQSPNSRRAICPSANGSNSNEAILIMTLASNPMPFPFELLSAYELGRHLELILQRLRVQIHDKLWFLFLYPKAT